MKKLKPAKKITMIDPITQNELVIGRQYCYETFISDKGGQSTLDIVCLYPNTKGENADIFTFNSFTKKMKMYFISEKTQMPVRRIYFELTIDYQARYDKETFIELFIEHYTKWLCYINLKKDDIKQDA